MLVKTDIDAFMADWREKFKGQHRPESTGKIEKNIEVLRSVLREEHTLLDVGCNIGSVYRLLGHKNYQGIDLDPVAVETAKQRFPGIDFKVGDLFSIEGLWDVILVSRVLMHVAPFKTAMDKLLRSSRKFLVLFVPISEEDECEVHGHDLDGAKVYSYFRRFSEKSLRDCGMCGIYRTKSYSTVIYDPRISER